MSFLITLLCTVAFLDTLPYKIVEAAEKDEEKTDDTLENLSTLYQPYITKISSYKPIYFLLGADPQDSRFQLSFKYQLFSKKSPLASRCPWVTDIHLGYTQTSSWDLESDSSPFEDTSYMPEVFFLSKNLSTRDRWLDGFFLQAGVLHESNGRDDEESRSTNCVYFSPKAVFYDESSRIGFYISPKLVYFFNNSDDTNPYIEDYRGNYELDLKVGMAESVVFGSTFRFASEGTSVQMDISYPLSMSFFSSFEFYLHVQYVNTLAETLLNYKVRTEAIRFGFSIVR